MYFIESKGSLTVLFERISLIQIFRCFPVPAWEGQYKCFILPFQLTRHFINLKATCLQILNDRSEEMFPDRYRS